MKTIFVTIWALLALSVIVLALYRKFVSMGEDDILHVRDSEAPLVAQQVAVEKKLGWIDHWGKMGTVAVLVYGLVIAAVYLYAVWQESTKQLYSLQ